jgi:hypothetical protein
MTGKLLNRLLPSGKKGLPRKQVIDPKLLPVFATASPQLGPAGSYTVSDDQGWLTIGCLLKKPQ